MFRNRTTSVGLSGTLVLILFMTGLAFGVQQDSMSAASPQPGSPGFRVSTSPAAAAKADTLKGGLAYWTDQGGPVMYPIYAVFIIGLGVVIYQFVRIFFDTRYAKPIKTTIEKKLGEEESGIETTTRVQEIWALVRQYPRSNMAKLLDRLCDLWHRDPSAEALQVEIDGYVSSVKDRYEIGRNFAILLSDTAGALGLLGTVLGMYATFMPGTLESSQIISGMGVALVTTIGGLIVSIILNFAISWAHSTFHAHLEGVMEHADRFRNRFGKGQAAGGVTQQVEKIVRIVERSAAAESPEEKRDDGVEVKRPQRLPAKMKILSGNNQVAEAGASLPKALEVAVEDQYGNAMEKLAVTFETNGSLITFDNGENLKQVDTDALGRAKVHVRLGKMIGKHKVTARVNGKANLSEDFEVEGRPGPPDKVHLLSGHLQMAPAGVPLPEPLSLKLEDAWGNPVPDHPVIFEVAYNNGRLDRDKARVEIHTDDEGVASVGFRLSETPGANIVKAMSKSKSGRRLEVSFESMGKE